MSQNEADKDFLDWVNHELIPTIQATQQILKPYIIKFNQFVNALSLGFAKFLKDNEDTIKTFVEFSKAYPVLKPYIDNVISGIKDPDFEIANDVLSISDIIDAIDLEKDPQAISLLTLVAGEPFQKSLIDFYSNLQLAQERTPLIEEALHLHNNGHYAGSICLLYGLIEGILTESFAKANYIIINKNKINPIDPSGNIDKRKNLTGLVPKLEHAINHQDELKNYYEKIKAYELVAGNSNETIPKTRNTILHGGSTDFNTEKRSAQLILWLYSALLNISNIVI